MFAVIETGGKQYKVSVGETVRVETIEAEVGAEVVLERVLLAHNGSEARIGSPLVEGAKVTAKVKAHGRGKKVIAQKHRRRKQYMRRRGHRQNYTDVEILTIQA
ncbi:MAG: 50S ribosomal protein L21 [Candidatus Wallbacteria bacterium]|nr:50S ribosomal protein L21 [Candidatus Wallbacteria bacterium]MBI4868687.1 50S ribosomal protein L21 [Candidatus Wallbacteria bacterium]